MGKTARTGARGAVLPFLAGACLSVVCFAPVASVVSASCPEVCLDVSQGSRYYGRYRPVSTPTSVKDFYRYEHYSFNGDDIVPLLRDQSLFLVHYEDRGDSRQPPNDDDGSGDCSLSFAIVHDSKEDYTGGQARFFVSGNHEDPIVQDGPGDGSRSDRYVYKGDEDGTTELFWEWGWQQSQTKKYRTDGMADAWWGIDATKPRTTPDDDDDENEEAACLVVSAKFIFGIVAWRFVPGSIDGVTGTVLSPDDYLYLDMDETLRVCRVDCGDEKEPRKDVR
mmetsp:Transcript_21764/g.45933  ORF Transcript_21764/g.45933 Transcript_21764/m.45933 type:complete len:279 (+) Transcript_21764:202-1038(+)